MFAMHFTAQVGNYTNQNLGDKMSDFKKRMDIKREVIEREFEMESIKTRVRDIEWLIEMGEDSNDGSFDDRRKALDKLKFVSREVAELKIRLLDE